MIAKFLKKFFSPNKYLSLFLFLILFLLLLLLFLFLFSFLITFAFKTSAYAQNKHSEKEIVSVEVLKKYATLNNFKIKSLRNKLESIKYKINQKSSAFYPKIGLAAGVDKEGLEEKSHFESIGHIYANINLFNGFYDLLTTKKFKLEFDMVEKEIQNEEFKIGQDIELEFYRYLLKSDLINLKSKLQEKNDFHKKLVEQGRNKGFYSDTDVMEFHLKSTLLQSELSSLKQELFEVRLSLKKLLGEEVGINIIPSGSLPHQHLKGEFKDYAKDIHKTNFDILKSTNELSQILIEQNIVQNKWLPKIDFEIKSGYLESDERTALIDTPETKFLLLAKMELFSGFETSWEKRENSAEINRINEELKGNILNSLADLELNFRRIKSIEEKADLEKDNEEASKKYYNAILGEYKRGFKNSSDLKNATDSIYGFSERKLNLLFEALEKRIQLENSLGRKIAVQDLK